MAATVAVFDSLHSGPLHCVEFDFFATRLATASSDRTIRLWRVHSQSNDSDHQQQQLQTSLGTLLPPGQLVDGTLGGGLRLGGDAGGASVAAGATLLQELHAHDGPVWQVRWAHPSFGNILASCGYDKRIVVWQQQRHGSGYDVGPFSGYGLSQEPGATGTDSSSALPFVPVYSNEDHAASVNALAFAPPEWGLMLAAGSSDGSISILTHPGEGGAKRGFLDPAGAASAEGIPAEAGWTRQAVFSAHFNGVYAIVWAPACPLLLQGEEGAQENIGNWEAADGLAGGNMPTPMLASGGADCQVRIWGFDRQTTSWIQLQQLKGSSPHTDWVRDVAFQPASAAALLLPSALLLASCSEDSSVKLWVYDAPSQKNIATGISRPSTSVSRKPQWRLLQTLPLNAPVWRIAWSASGTLLAAACGDEEVVLFRESVSGVWETIKKLSGPPPVKQLPETEPPQNDQGTQEQGMSQQGLQQPALQQSAPQQLAVSQQQPQGALQQPPMGQQVGATGMQDLPPRLQQLQEVQQHPLQMQTPPQQPQQPQALNVALRYPRPQGPLQPLQQQMLSPASLFPPPQRPPLSQEPPLAKQAQMPGPPASTSYGGIGFPSGPYPPPAVTAPGARLQQQQVSSQQQMPLQQSVPPSQQMPSQPIAQTSPWKATSNATSAARGPPMMSQQTPTGLSGVGPALSATFNCPVPPPGPSLPLGGAPRQQPFTQQPLSQQQPPTPLQQAPLQQPPPHQPLVQQQVQHQNEGPPGTMMAGSGGPPLPPPFLAASLSQAPGGATTQSVLPPAATMQQPRSGVGINPFQGYQPEETLFRPPLQQQPGLTGGQLPPPPPTAAGLTPPLSMQQHAFASGGARQQQSLYTPYKTS